MKGKIKIFENIFYLSLTIFLFTTVIGKPILPVKFNPSFIGFSFIGAGTFGLIKNQILLTRSQPLNYKEGSLWGIAFNIILCMIGTIVFAYGIIILLFQ